MKELSGETKERKFLKMLGKNYLDAEKDAPLLRELLNELDPNTKPPTLGVKPAVDSGRYQLFRESELDNK